MVVRFFPLTRGLDPDGTRPVGDLAGLVPFSVGANQKEGNNCNIVVHLRLEICHSHIDSRNIH